MESIHEKIKEEIKKKKVKKISDILLYHDIDLRFKNQCPKDINETFIMMGKDDRIGEFLPTEFVTPRLSRRRADLGSKSLKKEIVLNMECESGESLDLPVMKQEDYCKEYYKEHGLEVKPIIFTILKYFKETYKVQWGCSNQLYSMSYIYSYALINGDEMLKEVKKRIIDNKPLKRRHIIFLTWAAYTTYTITKEEMLTEISKIINIAELNIELKEELKIYHVQDCIRLIKDIDKRNKIFEVIDMECGAFKLALEMTANDMKQELDMIVDEWKEEERNKMNQKIKEKDEEIKERDDEIKRLKEELIKERAKWIKK